MLNVIWLALDTSHTGGKLREFFVHRAYYGNYKFRSLWWIFMYFMEEMVCKWYCAQICLLWQQVGRSACKLQTTLKASADGSGWWTHVLTVAEVMGGEGGGRGLGVAVYFHCPVKIRQKNMKRNLGASTHSRLYNKLSTQITHGALASKAIYFSFYYFCFESSKTVINWGGYMMITQETVSSVTAIDQRWPRLWRLAAWETKQFPKFVFSCH